MKSNDDADGTRRPLRVFLAYSKKDESYRQRLEVYLRPLERQQKITIWHDGNLVGGDEWDEVICRKLEEADIILFLISPDLFNTDYVEDKEIPLALERHRSGDATVIPLLLKHALTKGHPLMRLQGFPKGLRPVESSGWGIEEAFYEIAMGLDEAIETHRRRLVEKNTRKIDAALPTGQQRASLCLIAAPEDSLLKERFYKELFPFAHEGLFLISDLDAYTLDRTVADKLQSSLET